MKYLILVCLLFVACLEGPTGPVGPQGPQGIAGPDAKTVTFSLTFRKAVPESYYLINTEDSSYIVDNVYVSVISGFMPSWSPLPYTDYSPGFINATLQSKVIYGAMTQIVIEVQRADNQLGWPYVADSAKFNFMALLVKCQ